MFDAVAMLYLYVETPLHAGVGSGLSAVDLPIQRERTTQYPMIQGSGIKGKLRAQAEEELERLKKRAEESGSEADKERVKDFRARIWAIFGPDTSSPSEYASALVVGDARILLFPVRSLAGVYAYVTSADVLCRFNRELMRLYEAHEDSFPPTLPNDKRVLVTLKERSKVTLTASHDLVLEEFPYQATPSADLDAVADWIAGYALPDNYGEWKQRMRDHMVVLPEDDFRDFLLYSTEISTHVALDRNTKTVKEGPWTQEHLPADTLLYTPIYATETRNGGTKLSAQEVIAEVRQLSSRYMQLGGDETTGRGIVCLTWQPK